VNNGILIELEVLEAIATVSLPLVKVVVSLKTPLQILMRNLLTHPSSPYNKVLLVHVKEVVRTQIKEGTWDRNLWLPLPRTPRMKIMMK
jgi:hypothetical protein